MIERSRKKRKKREREQDMLDLCRMSARDLIRVLEIDMMFGRMKVEIEP